jgi:hypothetical protein
MNKICCLPWFSPLETGELPVPAWSPLAWKCNTKWYRLFCKNQIMKQNLKPPGSESGRCENEKGGVFLRIFHSTM